MIFVNESLIFERDSSWNTGGHQRRPITRSYLASKISVSNWSPKIKQSLLFALHQILAGNIAASTFLHSSVIYFENPLITHDSEIKMELDKLEYHLN